MCQVLMKYVCPEKFTTMIQSLYTGIMVNIRHVEDVSDTFAITNGIKPGSVLVSALLSIFLSAMLEKAFREMWDGVYIQTCHNADLFTVAYFRAKTKTTNILVR